MQIYLNDYAWRKIITYNIPITHILYVTSTEQIVYFNNFVVIYFIIALFNIKKL
jgi:hypothetical protein